MRRGQPLPDQGPQGPSEIKADAKTETDVFGHFQHDAAYEACVLSGYGALGRAKFIGFLEPFLAGGERKPPSNWSGFSLTALRGAGQWAITNLHALGGRNNTNRSSGPEDHCSSRCSVAQVYRVEDRLTSDCCRRHGRIAAHNVVRSGAYQ